MSVKQTKEPVWTVLIEVAKLYPSGHVEIVRTPFWDMPDWLKDKINPTWNHPGGCECIQCRQSYELGSS